MNEALSVLVVDDDGDVRSTVAEILQDEGFAVGVAENGRVALEALLSGLRPKLILLDMMMPEMDGWAFRAQQRQHPHILDIPVVIFTAHGVSPEAVVELGVAGFLRKPLRLDELLTTVKRFAS
jgi:two-component system response regulator MprA